MGVSISSSNPSRGDVKPQRSSTTATSNSVTPDLDDARSDATSDTSMEAREAIRSAIRAVARSKRTNRAAQQAHNHTTTADSGGLHHTSLRARDTQTLKQTITAGSYHSHQKQTSHLQEWLATLNAPVVAAA